MPALMSLDPVTLNGHNGHNNHDHRALSSAPDSPAIPSPPHNPTEPTVKIDLAYSSRESDVRHEPVTLNIQKSVLDLDKNIPSSVPIDPTHVSPPPTADVQMAEQPVSTPALTDASDPPLTASSTASPTLNGLNGINGIKDESNTLNGHDQDSMHVDEKTPVASTSRLSEPRDMDLASSTASPSLPSAPITDDHPPPFKRARTDSDAEMSTSASAPALAHSPTVLPPPTTAASSIRRSPTPSPDPNRTATFTVAQFRFCVSTIRNLRKLKDAIPFLNPVDPVALNIPHYPNIVKHPMDFQTIDRKLASSNPQKPDPNPNNPRYLAAEEFVADVRLMFSNALLFNGPDHAVTQMGKRVEAIFDKQIKQMPADEPVAPKKVQTPEPVSAPPKKSGTHARRPSTSVPTIRRSEAESATARPKREIHPPPPKDLAYAEPMKKMRSVRKAKIDNGAEEQMKFCAKLLQELHKKSYFTIAEPFYEPVDTVKLNIPHYHKVVKKPMDLRTMREKLEAGEYPNPDKFKDDFNLMIRNCMAFNPSGTLVHDAGVELDKVFKAKWAGLPPLRMPQNEYEDEDDEEDESEAEVSQISALKSQIQDLQDQLQSLESKRMKRKKKEKKPVKQRASPPVPSSSKASKPAKPVKKRSSKKQAEIPGEDVLSFEQKKDLSETIQQLDGDKLEKVIHIIHEGVPEIRDSAEEIELDIDTLPAPVLQKLYNFVIRPLKPAAPKRSRTGTGTGTGGLKRKSMDEDVEAEKIRQLEERMRMFDEKGTGAASMSVSARSAGHGARHANDSEHSSDESSSESSGSDSE